MLFLHAFPKRKREKGIFHSSIRYVYYMGTVVTAAYCLFLAMSVGVIAGAGPGLVV